MKAGKDVYCEKPMIHLYADGPEMIEAAKSTKRILQIGSQRVSSIIYAKAKEMLPSGAIGKLNMVTAHLGPQLGDGRLELHRSAGRFARDLRLAPLPRHRSQNSLQRRAFFPVAQVESLRKRGRRRPLRAPLQRHAFHHRLARAHARMATGGLRFWKDGRDANDVLLGLFDYPKGSISACASTSWMAAMRAKAWSSLGRRGPSRLAGPAHHQPLATRKGTGPHRYVTDGMQKRNLTEYDRSIRSASDGPPAADYEKYVAPTGTPTATTTSRTSSPQCEHGSRWWKMQSSDIVPPEQRCSATSASSEVR